MLTNISSLVEVIGLESDFNARCQAEVPARRYNRDTLMTRSFNSGSAVITANWANPPTCVNLAEKI